MRIPKDMTAGSVFETNSNGLLEIIAYNGSKDVSVRFINTGYAKHGVRVESIRSGVVKDPNNRSIYGVGYLGEGCYSSSDGSGICIRYNIWHSMLQRCYSEKAQQRNPTYVGCYVCEEWLNFQTFAKWFDKTYIVGYQLDKDIKVSGNKIYSPDTCLWVPQEENVRAARVSKNRYTMRHEVHGVVSFNNQSKFCKEYELTAPNISNVLRGRAAQHKGWYVHEET